MTFRDREKERYKKLKPKLFSPAAQGEGNYRGRPRSFCLADDYSSENLYEANRALAIEYFRARNIIWHDGLDKGRKPSNHLCCSQSCCVNFLYPMTTKPRMLASVFQHFYSELVEPLPINEDLPLPNGSFPYIAFEWIGVCDYLGETKRKGANRTRGAHFTSADFVFRFRRNDNKIHIVLGEWKYTEEYSKSDKGIEVRKNNYRPAFNRNGGIFAGKGEDVYSALFFEPYYQLMRLQLLAQEMQVAGEMDADLVTVLHICPEANNEFREKVTSLKLRELYPGKNTLEVWKELVPSDRFKSITVEDLLDTIIENAGRPEDRGWADYLKERYGWNRGD